jgi:hypothetical protein
VGSLLSVKAFRGINGFLPLPGSLPFIPRCLDRLLGGYPEGQQWDIRPEALTPDEQAAMEALPFPPRDPLDGTRGPVVEHWLHAA